MSGGKFGNKKLNGDAFMSGTFVPIDGTQKQIPNTGLDERTYDFMQAYLSGHGFTDAANELKNVKKFFEFYSE